MAFAIICLATNQKFNFSKYIFESTVKNMSNDPPLSRVNTLRSGEDRLKLKELIDLCTKLSDTVLDLETTKTGQVKEIASLKKRVKKLERKRKSKSPGMKRLFKIGRSAQVVSSEDEGRYDDAQMFDTDVFDGEEVFVAEQSEKVIKEVVSIAKVSVTVTITTEEITLAQTLAELKSAKPKIVVQEPVQSTTTTAPSIIPRAKGIVFHEQKQALTLIVSSQQPTQVKEKGKGKMVEKEPMKKMSKKELLKLDEEVAFKLQAEEEEQARLAREKAKKVEEANISWDNVQAMIEADRLLAERFQAREQEELTNEEKARLFVELLEKRKKHFEALRAQKRGTSHQLKHKRKKLFDKAMTRVNMFIDKDTELVKENSKKAEEEMVQESSSKKAGEELEQEIVQDDEVAIDAIPLATKPAVIVDYKIHKKGRNGYYEIIRADGSAKTYLLFSQLIKSFDREDLETLWKLVKAKHRNTKPEEGYERVPWGDLKTMFEHHVEDIIWRSLQGKKVLLWRLYDSCGIHFVRFEDIHVYMLVEKRYPLTPATITDMLNKKLKSDYWNEICYQLLKLMTKQLKKQYDSRYHKKNGQNVTNTTPGNGYRVYKEPGECF
ncbi:hypothetical protein Tco_1072693 [Tanacetum coccineum]